MSINEFRKGRAPLLEFFSGDINYQTEGGTLVRTVPGFPASDAEQTTFVLVQIVNVDGDLMARPWRKQGGKYIFNVTSIKLADFPVERRQIVSRWVGVPYAEMTPVEVVRALHDYGYGDEPTRFEGNNFADLMKKARAEVAQY